VNDKGRLKKAFSHRNAMQSAAFPFDFIDFVEDGERIEALRQYAARADDGFCVHREKIATFEKLDDDGREWRVTLNE